MLSDSLISVELWGQIPPDAQVALRSIFAIQEKKIESLQQQVKDLQQQLQQSSINSSRPPSSDGPQVKRKPPKKPSRRSQGAQPGHSKAQTPPLPSPDETRPGLPKVCRRCCQPLSGTDAEPLAHRVIDIPPCKLEVIEYHLHRLRCKKCGITTCADLPEGVPTGSYGPRLQGVVSLLTGAYWLSKRNTKQILLLDLRESGGSRADDQ